MAYPIDCQMTGVMGVRNCDGLVSNGIISSECIEWARVFAECFSIAAFSSYSTTLLALGITQ